MKIGKYVNQYCRVQREEQRLEFNKYWRMNLAKIRLLCVLTGMMTALDIWFVAGGAYNLWYMPFVVFFGLLFMCSIGSSDMPGQLTSKVIIDETGVYLKTKRKGEKLIRWQDVARVERYHVNVYDYDWLLIYDNMNECIRFYDSEEIEAFIFEMHPECKQMLKVFNGYVRSE